MNLNVLYEDNHIIVVLKPMGILSQAGEMDKLDMVNILKQYLKEKYHKPGNVYLGLVHRLDLNVSGVMVFAKTSKAAKRLSEQVRVHDFSKRYLAIAKGEFKNKESVFKDYIVKDEDQRMAIIGDEKNGKLAKLKYTVLDTSIFNDELYSLVEVELITGRFHQIRFQMAYHGHPLYGDVKYGDALINNDFFIGLHAYSLTFSHPIKQITMSFKSKPSHELFRYFEGINKIQWEAK